MPLWTAEMGRRTELLNIALTAREHKSATLQSQGHCRPKPMQHGEAENRPGGEEKSRHPGSQDGLT